MKKDDVICDMFVLLYVLIIPKIYTGTILYLNAFIILLLLKYISRYYMS